MPSGWSQMLVKVRRNRALSQGAKPSHAFITSTEHPITKGTLPNLESVVKKSKRRFCRRSLFCFTGAFSLRKPSTWKKPSLEFSFHHPIPALRVLGQSRDIGGKALSAASRCLLSRPHSGGWAGSRRRRAEGPPGHGKVFRFSYSEPAVFAFPGPPHETQTRGPHGIFFCMHLFRHGVGQSGPLEKYDLIAWPGHFRTGGQSCGRSLLWAHWARSIWCRAPMNPWHCFSHSLRGSSM